MKHTIIKWQTVNTRKKENNLPKLNSTIVYKLPLSSKSKELFPNEKELIITSRVYQEDENLFAMYMLTRIPFTDGFMWCYLDDIEDLQE